MYISEELVKKAAIKAGGKLSKVTLKVIEDFNMMNGFEFMTKYQCTKPKYFARILAYGDPYMRAPLARFGKFLMSIRF